VKHRIAMSWLGSNSWVKDQGARGGGGAFSDSSFNLTLAGPAS